MPTIEERAEQWAREYMQSDGYDLKSYTADLIAAYLAGSAQTQADYTAEPEFCQRCVCTCGAR